MKEPAVADSTCLIALEQIGYLDLLPTLFDPIQVPLAVERVFGAAGRRYAILTVEALDDSDSRGNFPAVERAVGLTVEEDKEKVWAYLPSKTAQGHLRASRSESGGADGQPPGTARIRKVQVDEKKV